MKNTLKYVALVATLFVIYLGLYAGLSQKTYTKSANGTGFFVSSDGYVVTNQHVVDKHKEVYVLYKGLYVPAVVIAEDIINDVAILKIETRLQSYYKVQRDFKNYSPVAVFGYPRPDVFGKDIKYAEGTATKSSLGDYINITTKIYPGNSGSPVVAESGNVVGIAEFVWLTPGTDRWGGSTHAGAVYVKHIIKLASVYYVPVQEAFANEITYKLTTLFTEAKEKNKSVLILVRL